MEKSEDRRNSSQDERKLESGTTETAAVPKLEAPKTAEIHPAFYIAYGLSSSMSILRR